MQLNIIRKDSTQFGKEELRTESVTVTVKEGADEPVPTKPGTHTCTTYIDQVHILHEYQAILRGVFTTGGCTSNNLWEH